MELLLLTLMFFDDILMTILNYITLIIIIYLY